MVSTSGVSGCAPAELWGGVEYTCNRVRDRYFDQMELSGHATRLSDYEALLALGIHTLRTGVLWERHERSGNTWAATDAHLGRQRELGIRPIASLVHHGSGPEHTDLLDPQFAEKLAGYAGQVAARYPWIDMYTPVNEPNATARFSGLYGAWYPHHRSRNSFLRAFLNQVKASVLAMRAIRAVRSDAKFLHTDDGGFTSGTPELQSTCDLLNLRQWLACDLLCGFVEEQHPMFHYLLGEGISSHEILWFAENACPPDIVGINYYVTSDRYLDHRVELYPTHHRSAEGPYVDVEAVRVLHQGIAGISHVLQHAWRRYGLPVAITEAHLGCSVDEQIRWTLEMWNGMQIARRAGVGCIAMTSWALLGSYFWNELVTRENGHYESGAFAVCGGTIKPTALAGILSQLAAGSAPSHPAISGPGWWHDPGRPCFPSSASSSFVVHGQVSDLVTASV